MSSFSYVDVDSLEGEGPGGAVRKTRRALGARAFGFNYFVLPPNQSGREHSHEESMQEEVYFVVKGSGTMQVEGEEVELKPGPLRPRRSDRGAPAGRGARRIGVHRVRLADRNAVRAASLGLGSAHAHHRVTDDELRLLRAALHSYLDDFGHDEADVLRSLKQLIAKLPETQSA